MHRDLIPSDYSVAFREILFVGFQPIHGNHILNFPFDDHSIQPVVEDNAFKAFCWLEERVADLDVSKLPYAVICYTDWLRNNDFLFARQIIIHPVLRYVPLIAISENGSSISQDQLSLYRIDDCYSIPVDWIKLQTRIEFLHQFKPKVLDQTYRIARENFSIDIPVKKRIFDVIGASLGILLSCWIWLPVMLAIWLESRGPVIYKSKRIGSGYQVFDFFKFRSMYHESDSRLQQLKHLNQYNSTNGQSPVFVKIPGDPRITRVGRFIRKYSIDELPQLLNVLRGDMSLVGNRPLPLYEAELLTRDEWIARFLAPSGITGLWQITKHDSPNMSAEERIALDLQYSRTR
ncbi:MAG: sugar transferase, partial [Saprospiraceae bacterium]|nr:sugar transferase [Saprospiraceae bacterium]